MAALHRACCCGSAALLACAANVVVSILSTCLYYRLLWELQAFPAFALQLCTFMQVIVCGCLLCSLERTRLAPQARQHPVRLVRWLELAGWLALQNTLEVAAVDGLGSTDGMLAPVLQQAVVPITLGLSIVLLGRRYAMAHWVAAALVIGGILTSYVPSLDRGSGVPWGWAALFVASRLPQSLANVRIEPVLQPPGPTDCCIAASAEPSRPQAAQLRTVLRAGFWTAALGLGLNVPTSWLLACTRGGGLDTLLRDYRGGTLCLLGHNASSDGSGAALGSVGCDGGAARAAALFSLPGVLFALSEFHVVQAASAAAYFLVTALELPLQAAALAAPFLMGALTSTVKPTVFYGVPLIVLGLTLWAHAEHRRTSSNATDRGCEASFECRGGCDAHAGDTGVAELACSAGDLDGTPGTSTLRQPLNACVPSQ